MAERGSMRAPNGCTSSISMERSKGSRGITQSIAEIARLFPALKIQVGGGIRSMATLESLFSAGIQRVVLGTAA